MSLKKYLFMGFTLFLVGCRIPEQSFPRNSPSPYEKEKYVLVVGLDGLRPDALIAAKTPNIDKLIANGRYSMNAKTQLSAIPYSGPGWASVLTGVDPIKHKVTNNYNTNKIANQYKTFLWHGTQSPGLKTIATFAWPKIAPIVGNNGADLVKNLDDELLTQLLEKKLKSENYQITFAQFNQPDNTGHGTSFSVKNPKYLAAIESKDKQIGRIMRSIQQRPNRKKEKWLIVVTTDHAAHPTLGHGRKIKECQTIPLIFSGDGLGSGEIKPTNGKIVSHLDVFPTVIHYLGGKIDPAWDIDGVSRLPQDFR